MMVFQSKISLGPEFVIFGLEPWAIIHGVAKLEIAQI